MDRQTYERVQEILGRTLKLPPTERDAFVGAACDGDGTLRGHVVELLELSEDETGAYSEGAIAAHRAELDSQLDVGPVPEHGATATEQESWCPTHIAGYEIHRIIGRGGTGVVFEGTQARPSRRVAIKLIHPALATPAVSARLSREAEALGRLQHPGIAQIFEAGVFDAGMGEQPFIAIEYVDGLDLIRHAHARALDPRGRVALLASTCDAVEHAHERGVIHRDLKPSNVLVDGRGQPKLLDFGIARIADEGAGSLATVDGQILGTLAYMAPEQARAGAPVDVRTDVFALGALGYELICHRRQRSVDGLSWTQAIAELADRPPVRPREIDRAIEGDLETVILKALELRPEDRYASAAALAADLRRFLEHRPIAARPPSAWKRVTKFARRNRTLVLGVATALVLLIAGIVATAYQARLADRANVASQRQLYFAEMRLATAATMDPANSMSLAGVVERWRPTGRDAAGMGAFANPSAGQIGWEWHLIDSVGRRNTVHLACPGYPMSIDWHPDGERLVVAMESELGVFDSRSGASLLPHRVQLPDRSGLWTGVAWSPAGEEIAMSGSSGMLLYGVRQGVNLWEREGGFLPEPLWSHDGRRIFSSTGVEPGIACFDALDGASLPLEGLTESVRLRFRGRAGGRLVPAVTGDGELLVLDAESMASARSLGFARSEVLAMCMSPDESAVAIGMRSGDLRVVDVGTAEDRWTVHDHLQPTFGVDWHPDGDRIATSSEDSTVRLFDAADGAALATYLGHASLVREVQWSPTGDRLASVAVGGEVLVWDVTEAEAIRSLGHGSLGTGPVPRELSWGPGPTQILASSGVGAVVFDLAQGGAPPRSAERVGRRASISASGRFLAASLGARELRIHEAGTLRLLQTAEVGTDTFLELAWHPSEPQLALASSDGIYLADVRDQGTVDLRRVADFDWQVADIEWAPNGRHIAVCSWALQTIVFDALTGACVMRYKSPRRVSSRAVAWSTDSAHLAIASSDAVIRLIEVPSGQLVGTLVGHGNQVEAVAWQPHGGRLASGGRDRTVKVWDPNGRALAASFEVAEQVAAVCWSPDGRLLTAFDWSGHVYVWDASRSYLEVERGIERVGGGEGNLDQSPR